MEKSETTLKPKQREEITSIILAAGRGSRMQGYDGNKTLLPLVEKGSFYEGSVPIITEIMRNLPKGPKAIVVHHRKEEVVRISGDTTISFYEQKVLNGTGGALLAARPFLEKQNTNRIIITMGDIPFVKGSTYRALTNKLDNLSMVVLGFMPESKKQYGVLEISNDLVTRIIEWKYWKNFPDERRSSLHLCNSGIYAARREDILSRLPYLELRPHRVRKRIGNKESEVNEYFITDLVEYMNEAGLSVGYITATDEKEVMGIDDPAALEEARRLYLEGGPKAG